MQWSNSKLSLRGTVLTGLLSISAAVMAQPPGPGMPRPQGGPGGNVMYFRSGSASGAFEDRVLFVGPTSMVGGGVVKGVPYSATATVEMTQPLADGNRIHHGNSSKTYRDSEGRTRRDQTLPAIGPFPMTGQPSGEPPSLSFIFDPIANVSYVLNHTDKTARKMPAPQWIQGGGMGSTTAVAMPPPPPLPAGGSGPGPGIGAMSVMIHPPQGPPPTGNTAPPLPDNVRREDLGKKLIEGIEVEGTRTVMTIAVGAIGNDLPIEVVTEEWRSPILQLMVSSKHSDPRAGVNTYALSGISRSEPDPSLFKVPADYSLLEGAPGPFNIAIPAPAQP
jgi:hypothetical protein